MQLRDATRKEIHTAYGNVKKGIGSLGEDSQRPLPRAWDTRGILKGMQKSAR